MPPETSAIRVLVVDDHPMFRQSVAAAVGADAGLQLVADLASGSEALALLRREPVDVVICDLKMPDVDGMAVLTATRQAAAPPAVILLSAFDDGATVHRALQAGAAGFLSKAASQQEILTAVGDVVRRGLTVVSPELQQSVLARISQEGEVQALSPRETQILGRISEGAQLAEIGGELGLSTPTVKTYLHRAYEKLGVNDRAAAVAEAMRRGIL